VIYANVSGANVFVNGVSVGVTSNSRVPEFRIDTLPVGVEYVISLTAPGYEKAETRSRLSQGVNYEGFTLQERYGSQQPTSKRTETTSATSKTKWWEWALLGAVAVAGGYLAYEAGKAGASIPPSSALGAGRRVLIFGGKSGTVFLGCMNCASYDPDSLDNSLGSFGNRYSPTSLMNRLSEYASRYSDVSACNPYAQNPPRLVDDSGSYFGVLTSNTSLMGRTRLREALGLLARVCHP
jgi:hypothetical protein